MNITTTRAARIVCYLVTQLLSAVGLTAFLINPHTGALILMPDGKVKVVVPSADAPIFLDQLRVIGLFSHLLTPPGRPLYDDTYAAYEALVDQTLEKKAIAAIVKVSQK